MTVFTPTEEAKATVSSTNLVDNRWNGKDLIPASAEVLVHLMNRAI